MFFDNEDSDSVFIEGLHSYIRLWIGQDSKGVLSFLENKEVIKITELKKAGCNRGLTGIRKDATVNRAKLTALKEELESSDDKFVATGTTMLVWGTGKKERRSRL